MAVQWSGTLRNAILDAWGTAIGNSAIIRIYTGAMPANVATSTTGTLLVEFDLASTWNSAAASGAKSLSSLPVSATSVATGVAGYYRIFASDGTTVHEQGVVTGTGLGGDLTIDITTITSGQTVQITTFTKTAPGA